MIIAYRLYAWETDETSNKYRAAKPYETGEYDDENPADRRAFAIRARAALMACDEVVTYRVA